MPLSSRSLKARIAAGAVALTLFYDLVRVAIHSAGAPTLPATDSALICRLWSYLPLVALPFLPGLLETLTQDQRSELVADREN